MLQVFHVNVAKIDRDVIYVASVSEASCKCLFKMFHLFSDLYLQAFWIWLSHMFHACCKSMLQWFQLFQSYVAVSAFILQVASFFIWMHMFYTHV
jgi:hypothetical protein